jgi:hypothetical protein
MDEAEIAEYCKSDPNGQSAEREFSVNFTKEDNMAYIHTTIASQAKRLLKHSDAIVDRLSVYNEDTDTYSTTTVEEFDGEPNIVWGIGGRIPIESLKIQGNPRSHRSYADIISTQGEVNIDGD